MIKATLAMSLFALLAIAHKGSSDVLYYENFDEGNSVIEANQWFLNLLGNGSFDASSGELMLSGRFSDMLASPGSVAHLGNLTNTSVRTQLTFDQDASEIGLHARYQPGDGTWYEAGINATDDMLYLGWRPGWSSSFERLHSAPANLDLTPGQDIILQFDVIDDLLSLRVWHPNESMPGEPQLEFRDEIAMLSVGFPGVHFRPDEQSSATFHFVQIGDSQINSDFLIGDFVGDGMLDLSDINRLLSESSSGNHNDIFDLNGDNSVDFGDVSLWVKEFRRTWFGDANLDGEFNSGDLTSVFQAGKYDQNVHTLWNEGDWTSDHRFNSSDLVKAFQDGGFEQGPHMATLVVPEPTSIAFLTFGTLGLLPRRMRTPTRNMSKLKENAD